MKCEACGKDGTLDIRESDRPDDMCKCGKNPATEPHGCPFAEEINDNNDPEYCRCCADCTQQCAEDI